MVVDFKEFHDEDAFDQDNDEFDKEEVGQDGQICGVCKGLCCAVD